ncbi:Fur family transcriptional regulator [Shewanella saliphila]|uniref:ABC transporter ATP-binding protein n=1 Tax=Shewanella saliphila TaxID=2282698 RepID=A0ABQ2QAI4_9GAMM|nr:Fur family transcriptional regulator [Shewanella saliphila]MCL1103320.1 transcriptional repressor [Shewanella saliphila]GGP68439.1 ABC transporter ATP-binding protein [Shewanella saliphila]
MNNIDTIIEHAEQNCKSHGSRLTTKRKQVLSLLAQTDKALSAYDLIDLFVKENGEKIPAMSVYRILDFLEAEHLVHKLKLANKYIACSHITCKHEHGVPQFLICSVCNAVKEITVNKSTINELNQSVEQAGFKLVSPQLEINCICNECLATAS